MENRWASPEGTEERPPAVRYRIRDKWDNVVERKTSVNLDAGRKRYYHALAPEDQHFADAIVDRVQRACAYFYASDEDYEPMEGVDDVVVSDEEVLARIERLDGGENTREAERTGKLRYPLTELPFDQQRALVERIEAMKREWSFEILGEEETGATPTYDPAATGWPPFP